MSFLALSARRSVRPAFGTPPNWDHPLFGGVQPLILYTGWENKDWTTPSRPMTTNGTCSIGKASPIGPGFDIATGENWINTARNANVADYKVTVFGVWVPTSSAANLGIAQANNTTANLNNLMLVHATTPIIQISFGDGLGTNINNNRRALNFTFALTANVPVAFAAVIKSNTTGAGFANGAALALGTGGTASVIAQANTAARISRANNVPASGSKNILLVGWRNGNVPDAMAQRFSAFPWEIFIPRKRVFYSLPIIAFLPYSRTPYLGPILAQ